VGARHFVDQEKGYAGLALFGTQFTGDHEDFLGQLGYPSDLGGFPSPLLALSGELDQMSIAHTAVLFNQVCVCVCVCVCLGEGGELYLLL
jgi:hypothetical protein